MKCRATSVAKNHVKNEGRKIMVGQNILLPACYLRIKAVVNCTIELDENDYENDYENMMVMVMIIKI